MKTAHLSNGDDVLWTSNTRRVRRVRIVTALEAVQGRSIVLITHGLPGEKGQYRLLPTHRLTPKGAP